MTTDRQATAADALREAQQLCEQLIARDLHELGQPLYLADHPAGLPRCANVNGYIGNERAVRLVLEHAGRWKGLGAMAVVDTAVIAESASPDPFSWRSLPRAILRTAIHETAHLLPLQKAVDDDAGLSRLERVVYAYCEAEEWAKPIELPATLPPWSGDHGASFVRRSLHLRHRAHRLGYRLGFDLHCGGEFYGLSPALGYADALGNEPARMMGCTFAEIESTPAPRDFRRLFQHDVRHWLHKQAKGNS